MPSRGPVLPSKEQPNPRTFTSKRLFLRIATRLGSANHMQRRQYSTHNIVPDGEQAAGALDEAQKSPTGSQDRT